MLKYKPTNRPYKIVEYNQLWAIRFEREASAVRQVLGSTALAIEHIGSTSVQGLAGKPTVDILVLVQRIGDADRFEAALVGLGYRAMGEYVMTDTRLFIKGEGAQREVNLHFFESNHPHVMEMLNLRDYLRNHSDEAGAYGALKQDLSSRYPDDYVSYRLAKERYVDALMIRVQAWARQLNRS